MHRKTSQKQYYSHKISKYNITTLLNLKIVQYYTYNLIHRFWHPNKPIRECLSKSYTSTEWTKLSERPKEKVTNMPPMSEPVRGLPHAIYANFKEEDQKTEVTVLPNGLRVASENRFGEFCTVGGIKLFKFLLKII